MDGPTYGELIELLEVAEAEAETSEASIAELLAAKFRCDYSHIPISRPSRFFDTIKRIAAPTRPSAIGQRRLNGSPLRFYLKRHWAPRIRNTQQGMFFNHMHLHVCVNQTVCTCFVL